MQTANPHHAEHMPPHQSWGPPQGLPPNVGGGPGFGPPSQYMHIHILSIQKVESSRAAVRSQDQSMAEINQGETMTAHDWSRIFVSYLQVHRDGCKWG